jgi:hypothetical protein
MRIDDIIFIPDRLRKIKSAIAIFSSFFAPIFALLALFTCVFAVADDIKERTCFSYSAPVSLNIRTVRAKKYQPFLDYVSAHIRIVCVPVHTPLLLLDVRLIIHAKRKK